ncbi:MAG: MarR family transcriptional regulator [Bacteroidales bacterium]|nr:MarR family transcriptional regulator [Bacteroidales bacterium]
MIDSKKLIEVMPLLSGNQYKIFVFLIYGYQMAIETYHQPYYEISQNEIAKATGVPRATAQRAITELVNKGLVSYSTKQQGQTKTRARYSIPNYEKYLFHFEANNDKINAQNDAYIKDNDNIDKQSSVLQSRPDLKGLYDTSNALGDALDSQTTIDGLNTIKDRFNKLWEEAESLYVYPTKYREDKDKNWGAFLKRYNGKKSKINRQTAKQHTPKQVDKRDKREISEMGTPRPAAPHTIAKEPLLFSKRFPSLYKDAPFTPAYLFYFFEETQRRIDGMNWVYSDDQIKEVYGELKQWIDNGMMDDECPVSYDSNVILTRYEWKEYARQLLNRINTTPQRGSSDSWQKEAEEWLKIQRYHSDDDV